MNIPDVGADLKAEHLCIQVKKKKLSKAIVNLYTAYQGFYKNIFEPVRDREQNNYSESKLSRGQLTILVKPQARSHFC